MSFRHLGVMIFILSNVSVGNSFASEAVNQGIVQEAQVAGRHGAHYSFTEQPIKLKNLTSPTGLKAKQSKNILLDPTPYFLPQKHRLRKVLDTIFADPKALQNATNFSAAGFTTLYLRPKGSLRVARHPSLKKYLFKLYLDAEVGLQKDRWQNSLVQRCIGAAAIKKIIKEQRIKHITVPKKWLYEPPSCDKSMGRTFILITQNMQLVKRKKSEKMWRKADKKVLNELFHIVNEGYASISLVLNIPGTKSGTFACIDTEFAQRKYHLARAKRFFSPRMQKHWNLLIKWDQLTK